ncbi:integrase, catalytic region, zinc finger, CCHC-type containing protein [Tanacetum coccineum]
MYKIKIVDKQEVHTQANKSVLTSTRLKGVNSVRRPSTRSSSSKNSVLSNTKNQTEVVEVSPRKNKKRKVTSQIHVVKNKYYVANVDVKNALKAKIDVLCVSCKKNMLTPCRDKCDTDNVVDYMIASSPVCLMSKATSIKSWLWHRKLSHRNFGTVNHLTKQDLVDGLLKFKYEKDHLCSACEQGKSKKVSLQPRLVPSTHSKLELIHMDMCGPMRMESINGKKYILVIVDDYSHYAWAYFIRTKDEAPDMITKFIAHV